ncbi:MAG: hypothetical protein K0R25_1396 [Rickettsiaceae bacterium]|jgi:prepilin-type N-terminal cleavage/methylation domain-containing protein|nr:hypothetical protein [Rickettsiaceae bacterium]
MINLQKNKTKSSSKLAFSLIELSVVILIIGILVIGITKGSAIVRAAKLQSAQSLTLSSPVASIDALRFWFEPTLDKSFDASEKLTGPISKWYDTNPQSSNMMSADQTTASAKPTYTASAINGLPALKFDGSDWLRMVIQTSTSDKLEVFTVCKRSALVVLSSSAVFHKAGTNDNDNVGRFILANEGLSSPFQLATARNGTKSVRSPHPGNNIPYIFSTSFDGTNNTAYYNGTAQTAVASTGNFDFDNVLIGARYTGGVENSMYNGYIAELIVFDRNLTATERKDVTKYLGNKWGIAVQ